MFFASHDNFEESALSFVRKLQGKVCFCRNGGPRVSCSLMTQAVLVHSRKAMLKAHEANQIFADNTPLVNKASEGTYMYIHVCTYNIIMVDTYR